MVSFLTRCNHVQSFYRDQPYPPYSHPRGCHPHLSTSWTPNFDPMKLISITTEIWYRGVKGGEIRAPFRWQFSKIRWQRSSIRCNEATNGNIFQSGIICFSDYYACKYIFRTDIMRIIMHVNIFSAPILWIYDEDWRSIISKHEKSLNNNYVCKHFFLHWYYAYNHACKYIFYDIINLNIFSYQILWIFKMKKHYIKTWKISQ